MLKFEEKKKQWEKYARIWAENEKDLKTKQAELEKELKEKNKEQEVQIISPSVQYDEKFYFPIYILGKS